MSGGFRQRIGPGVRGVSMGLALGLTGCVSMAPPYEPPPLPVRPAYEAGAGRQQAAAPASGIDWRAYFVEPRLQSLIAQALDNNRDLRAALARVEQARAAYGIQRADRFPTVGLGVDATRARQSSEFTLPGLPLVGSQYQVGVGWSAWELDFWGRVRSLQDAALENYLASDAARRAITLSLIAQVANTYLSLRELDERIALARQTTATRAESLRIFRRRYELGATSKLDLAQVETLWQQARTLDAQLAQARDAQRHALELLIGTPLSAPPGEALVADEAVFGEIAPGRPEDLLTNRPDVIAAEHQLKAAHADIGAARAAFFPRVTLGASIGSGSTEFDGLFGSGTRTWLVAPSLSLPILDAGRNRSNLELAQARRVEALAAYEKSIQSAFRDVADALSARRWLAAQVQTLQATQIAQAERARLAKLRYDSGAAAFLEVLDAQRDLLVAEQAVVQTRRELLASRVSLYAALGGGSALLPAATP